jgi:hypothetical protein
MSGTTTVAAARRLIAGAAHGAWMAVLLGVLFLLVTWALYLTMVNFAPTALSALVDLPLPALWALILRWYAALKLLLVGWALFAAFLSYWWRVL